MSLARACLACRSAKARCDREQPQCGRCVRRRLECVGASSDQDIVFLNENQVAERNSRRARRGIRSRNQLTSVTFDVVTTPERSSSHSQSPPKSKSSSPEHVVDPGLRFQYPWLNEQRIAHLAPPMTQDPDLRAVDRFFVNWTLYPDNEEISNGHMSNMQDLYISAPPQSVLWFAVRAVAYADMRNELSTGTPFSVKARQFYGAALSRLREVAYQGQNLANDHMLAAILLIDNFELMYLSRIEPLGPHRHAIKHILHTGGDDYLFNKSRFALWCVAHKRLQARQILLGEAPDQEQLEWVSKLNIDRPDNHISADVINMSVQTAAVKRLVERGNGVDADQAEVSTKLDQAQQLLQSIQGLISQVENWTSTIPMAWRPKIQAPNHDNKSDSGESDVDNPGSRERSPAPFFPCPRVLSYRDLWIAYIWNLHAASQIVLRESYVDVITYQATLLGRDLTYEEVIEIDNEENEVHKLSSAIIQSLPPLLGLTHRNQPLDYSRPPTKGAMTGRFFALFSMWIVQKARYTSRLHKDTAMRVIGWINSKHGLA